MAKLYFRYGTVMAAKSAQLLAVHDNYTRQGKKCLVVKPHCDFRYGAAVASRLGRSAPCDFLLPETIVHIPALATADCVLADEAQFLVPEWVDYFHELTLFGIPVICYGLRADYRGVPFPGSLRLFVLADSIEEIKTVCWVSSCSRKATQNYLWERRVAAPDDHHAAVMVGKQFIPLCRHHWHSFHENGPSDDLTPPALADASGNLSEVPSP